MCYNEHVDKMTSVSRNETINVIREKLNCTHSQQHHRSNSLIPSQFRKISPYVFGKENKGSRQSL